MERRLDDGQIEVVDDALAEVLKGKTPAERVAMICASNRTMRLLIEGHLRSRHRDWDQATISAEIARRMLCGHEVDRAYVTRWADRLGLTDIRRAALRRVGRKDS